MRYQWQRALDGAAKAHLRVLRHHREGAAHISEVVFWPHPVTQFDTSGANMNRLALTVSYSGSLVLGSELGAWLRSAGATGRVPLGAGVGAA